MMHGAAVVSNESGQKRFDYRYYSLGNCSHVQTRLVPTFFL